MKRYQIVESGAGFQFAGSKATRDAAEIAGRLGYKRCELVMRSTRPGMAAKLLRQIGWALDWLRVCLEIGWALDYLRAFLEIGWALHYLRVCPEIGGRLKRQWDCREVGRQPERARNRRTCPADCIVLLQHPFHYPQLTRKRSLLRLKARGVRFICLVHDVEELRGWRDGGYYREEFAVMLQIMDVLIVHNAAMRRFFIERGVDERRIVELGIFDYLMKSEAAESDVEAEENRIVIAGNLDPQKSGYLAKLESIGSVKFELYGGSEGRVLESQRNVVYCGCFPEDEPTVLLSGASRRTFAGSGQGAAVDAVARGISFGLVWDGAEVTGCAGNAGAYLRYNSPHKLSLYLACGLPVFIWREAAEAPFVERRGAGIAIDSLEEIPGILQTMSGSTYRKMAECAAAVGEQLRSGGRLRRAVLEAESRLAHGASGQVSAGAGERRSR